MRIFSYIRPDKAIEVRWGDDTRKLQTDGRRTIVPGGELFGLSYEKLFTKGSGTFEIKNPSLGGLDNIPLGDAEFSFDIFNRKAQGILNRALAAAKKLSAKAREDLRAILISDSPAQSVQGIIRFLDDYRVQLAKLLTRTQLAALLEGAQEVANKIPAVAPQGVAVPMPPSLEPHRAVDILAELRGMTELDKAAKIYEYTGPEQDYLRRALATESAGSFEPPPVLPSVGSVPSGEADFPTIDEAIRNLQSRNVMTRADFEQLDAAARTKAFAVAGVDANETLTKIRDAMAENVQEGADYASFREKVLADVDEGTFLSEGHMENVFRTNVQTAFSDGQMAVLSHPVVRSGFPYAAIESIADDRRRHNHGELEHLGIQGTNIYRIDDFVFQLFRAPWDYMCRCGWRPMSIRQAASKGIEEAKKWLSEGIEPSPPAFVAMPPFQPPPGFKRTVNAAPLSVRMSLEPMNSFASFAFKESDVKRDESGRFADKDVTDMSDDEVRSLAEEHGFENLEKWSMKRLRKSLTEYLAEAKDEVVESPEWDASRLAAMNGYDADKELVKQRQDEIRSAPITPELKEIVRDAVHEAASTKFSKLADLKDIADLMTETEPDVILHAVMQGIDDGVYRLHPYTGGTAQLAEDRPELVVPTGSELGRYVEILKQG